MSVVGLSFGNFLGVRVDVELDLLIPACRLTFPMSIISFQFHPEFTPEFGRALIKMRRDRYGALTDPTLTSYQELCDGTQVRRWIRCFLGMRSVARSVQRSSVSSPGRPLIVEQPAPTTAFPAGYWLHRLASDDA